VTTGGDLPERLVRVAPDSEIYYDRGPEIGCGQPDCAPGCDRCARYLEIWNLVFMQFYQDPEGNRTPLKQRNIDTGMGLERLAMVLQGKESVFDTDLFRPIIDAFATLAGTTYGHDAGHDRSLRVIADHARALVFLAADGVQPDNTGVAISSVAFCGERFDMATPRAGPSVPGSCGGVGD